MEKWRDLAKHVITVPASLRVPMAALRGASPAEIFVLPVVRYTFPV
jgi:hypothetical protein